MAKGFSARGDVLTRTADGRPLNTLWNEFQAALQIRNSQRTALDTLLTRTTTLPAEEVAQTQGGEAFERATEYGEPVGLRSTPDTIRFGYSHDWYDLATRYTWKFLAEADASQVEAIHNLALESDSRLTHNEILRALFNPAQRVNEDGTPVLGLWNGDGMAPPEHHFNLFTGTHNHYLTTGGALDGTDLAGAIEHVTHHGYGTSAGSRVIVFANSAEVSVIRGLRVASGSPFDFISGAAAPAYLTDQQIVGDQAPAAYESLPLAGSYGAAWVVEEPLIPVGYVLVAATGGRNAANNPVAFREHRRPELRGLRQIGGGNRDYPLTDSFYSRGFGTGVRHRGAAVALQVTAGAYTVPNIPLPR